MKKKFILFASISLVVLLCYLGFKGYQAYKLYQLTESSKEYVDATIPRILASWSEGELLNHADTRLVQFIKSRPEFLENFHKLIKLGKLRTYNGSKGGVSIGRTNKNGYKEIVGHYDAWADFERARVRINLRIILNDGEWKILVFNIFSPSF